MAAEIPLTNANYLQNYMVSHPQKTIILIPATMRISHFVYKY